MALLGAGAAFAGWNSEVVKKPELAKVEAGAAAALSATQANTTAQLGTLQAQVQDLRSRQAGVEASLAILTQMSQQMLDHLVEIGRATHARPVLTPP